MKNSVITLLCSLFLVSPAAVLAEENGPPVKRLSLDECISMAMAHSHVLEAERQRLKVLEEQIKQIYWTPFSNFFIEGTFTVLPNKHINEERLENEGVIVGADDMFDYKDQDWGPRFAWRAGFDVPLYTFGKMKAGSEALKAGEKAKQAEYPRFVHQVRLQVEQAYNAVSGAREMLYTIGQGRKFLKQAREKIEANLESGEGSTTQIDLIKIKVFEQEVDQYEAQAYEIERVGLAALRTLVGMDKGKPVDILDTPQVQREEEIKDLDEYKDAALSQRPELKALDYAVRAMEAKVNLRRAEFWPDFFVTGRFGGAYTPGSTDVQSWVLTDSLNYGPGFMIGLGLRYNLDLGLDIHKLRHAKAELAAMTTDQKAALDGIMLEVERVYHHAVAARDALASTQKSKKLVKGWISAVMQNHAIGLAEAKDVKDALKEYFKVMASLHKLTHDYNVGIAELDRVTGAPVGKN